MILNDKAILWCFAFETFCICIKYAQKKAKSMEKQLTTMEEIIVHSSNQIKVSLKNKSELILQLNLEIFELVSN